jgi:hypothetical protein
MHQQYLLRLASGDTSDTPGAAPLRSTELDPIRAEAGALARLAATIAEAGINLRSVGGRGIELGGEVALAVSDEDEDRLAELLEAKGYRFRVVEPHHEHLHDQPGALADFLGKLAAEGRLIDSINVATPDADGTIPVQARTVQLSSGSAPSTSGHVEQHGKHGGEHDHEAERGGRGRG